MGRVYNSVVSVKPGGFCTKAEKKIKKNNYYEKTNKKSSSVLKC